MKHPRILLLTLWLGVLTPAIATAESWKLPLHLSAGAYDRENTPVRVALPQDFVQKLDVEHLDRLHARVDGNGWSLPAQCIPPSVDHLPSLLAGTYDGPKLYLAFILPKLSKGEPADLTATISTEAVGPKATSFQWIESDPNYDELKYGVRPVLRYMRTPIDESSAEAREKTYKVFHHVYDPQGERFITKGPGGRYTHHRGLFFGFNRISYDAGKADVWHCKGEAHQAHDDTLLEIAGPVLGQHSVVVDWNGVEGKRFAQETRQLCCYATEGGQLIEFTTVLYSEEPVRLDGDPQHAGFQFRAAQEVADGPGSNTYYLRPSGKGEPGKTRNWSAKNPTPETTNLPWNAMSFVIDGQRYTAVYVDHPDNPKDARYSERDYGRFGSYFEYDLDEDNPLKLNYRVWVQEGEMTVEQAQALRNDFVHPVKVEIGKDQGAPETKPESETAKVDPPEGFIALFNGKDLSGWKGLVANPKVRAQMSAEELAAAQKEADENMRQHWHVRDGLLVFDGKKGGRSICTAKDYGDFDMYVDWKIGPHGDSGVYLRGSPQVQIWDPADHPEGSGGLYNNKEHPSKPLVCADNPIGEWNTFRIKMVGEKVTVWLNGELVVDDVVMENYWERDKPIYPTGQIELQNHGHELFFRNVYLKEIPRK